MSDEQDVSEYVLGEIDLDAPIHRIFRLWTFWESLRRRRLFLVSPRLWDDPMERLPEQIGVQWKDGDRFLNQEFWDVHLSAVFLQAWSRTSESDVLQRAYSRVEKDAQHRRNTVPRDEGVRVSTTPRKLLRTAAHGRVFLGSESLFLGAVDYHTESDIANALGSLIQSEGLRAAGRGRLRALSCLLKRSLFSHENEVRLIVVENIPYPRERDTIEIAFDPGTLFDQVAFDPRLEMFEYNERCALAEALGVTAPMPRLTWYDPNSYIVTLDQRNRREE